MGRLCVVIGLSSSISKNALTISYTTRSLAGAGRYTCLSEFQWTRFCVSDVVMFC
jgi:hypothetical protein